MRARFCDSYTRALRGALLALVASASLGCDTKSMGTVTGTVTRNGQPVTLGQVELFAEATGMVGTGTIDASGNFAIDVPLPAGDYAARVIPGWEEPGKPAPRGKAAAVIPKKAHEFASSGLTVTVNKGPNAVALELKD